MREGDVETIAFQEFQPDPASVAEVRHFVSEALERVGLDDDHIFECALIADELATNAVTHAGTIFSVAIELTDSFVRIAVRDDADEMPMSQQASNEAVSGRGLSIVDGTSVGWGTVPLGLGKETWADVGLRAS